MPEYDFEIEVEMPEGQTDEELAGAVYGRAHDAMVGSNYGVPYVLFTRTAVDLARAVALGIRDVLAAGATVRSIVVHSQSCGQGDPLVTFPAIPIDPAADALVDKIVSESLSGAKRPLEK